MVKNYFKTAWRSLWKNKTFSAINISGLSVGVAAFLLIINYLRFEYSYDDAHVKKDRIYRVPMMTKEKGGKEQTFAFTYPAVAPALKKDFPEIEEAARFRRQGGIVTYKDQRIIESGTLYYADAALFNAALIAFPLGWWAMNKWLEDFAYRIQIAWWVFPVAGIAALLIALLTVSIQAIRAAVANPVKSLRTE